MKRPKKASSALLPTVDYPRRPAKPTRKRRARARRQIRKGR